MIILGLDSAGKTAGVALMRDGDLLYENYLAVGLTHSETLLRLCGDALSATGVLPRDVNLFAAAAGPGSFTGLRIGLAAVKGMAFPGDTPCVPVSTLEALAYSTPLEGTVLCALDARRGEVYWAAFACRDGAVSRLTPDASAPAAALASFADSVNGPLWLLGDGAHLVADILAGRANTHLCPTPWRFGRAGGVCRAAAAAGMEAAVAPAQLVPEYHRLSQAQRERAQKLAAQAAAEN